MVMVVQCSVSQLCNELQKLESWSAALPQGLVELQLYIFRWLHGALVVMLVLICLRCGGLWYNFNQGAINAKFLLISTCHSNLKIKSANYECEQRTNNARAAYEKRANRVRTTRELRANYEREPTRELRGAPLCFLLRLPPWM